MPEPTATPLVRSCWTMSEGAAGMESQCIGLADALGLEPKVKRVRPRGFWSVLPPARWPASRAALESEGGALAPPWPELLISCGRKSVGFSIAIRRLSQGRTFTVHIQNPRVATRHFDLVVAPEHDRCVGPNVVQTRGAIHRVTPERLAEGAKIIAPKIKGLPRPLVAVLIGGTNRRYRFDAAAARDLGRQLAALAASSGAGLAITPSRRTGEESLAGLRQALGDAPATIWDGTGENPYFGYLALADAIVVTCDSASMVSEACSTGKPVYVAQLPGPGSARFRRFHDGLRAAGVTRPLTGALERWSYDPVNDTGLAAAAVRQRIEARRGLGGRNAR